MSLTRTGKGTEPQTFPSPSSRVIFVDPGCHQLNTREAPAHPGQVPTAWNGGLLHRVGVRPGRCHREQHRTGPSQCEHPLPHAGLTADSDVHSMCTCRLAQVKVNLAEYAGMPKEEAVADFKSRIEFYRKGYAPLSIQVPHLSAARWLRVPDFSRSTNNI